MLESVLAESEEGCVKNRSFERERLSDADLSEAEFERVRFKKCVFEGLSLIHISEPTRPFTGRSSRTVFFRDAAFPKGISGAVIFPSVEGTAAIFRKVVLRTGCSRTVRFAMRILRNRCGKIAD